MRHIEISSVINIELWFNEKSYKIFDNWVANNGISPKKMVATKFHQLRAYIMKARGQTSTITITPSLVLNNTIHLFCSAILNILLYVNLCRNLSWYVYNIQSPWQWLVDCDFEMILFFAFLSIRKIIFCFFLIFSLFLFFIRSVCMRLHIFLDIQVGEEKKRYN